MKIIVLDYEKQVLEVEFTTDELIHPLFSSTLSRMRNQDGFTVHKSGELVSVTVIDDDTYQTVGMAVDDIRELWMGDVVFEYKEEVQEVSPAVYDEEGNLIMEAVTEVVLVQLPKDLSKCPCFGFTPGPVPEPIPEPEIVPEVDPEI